MEDGEEERRENGEDKRERGEGKEEWKRRGGEVRGGGRGEEEHVCVHVHVREKEGKSTTFSLPLLEKLRGE